MVNVEELAQALGCQLAVKGSVPSREVTGGYCGDLLSWVMGRAGGGSAWITVMGNVNAVAVAVLADVACIILAEGAQLDKAAKQKAEQNGVAVLTSGRSAYTLAVALSKILEGYHTK